MMVYLDVLNSLMKCKLLLVLVSAEMHALLSLVCFSRSGLSLVSEGRP